MLNTIKISDFLYRKRIPVTIEPETEYSLVTIRLYHKGVVLRGKKKGALIGSKMYRVSKGDFILSGIDARNGAFGIVPEELDGAIVTNDFWYFDVDETKVKRDFFYWLTTTPLFLDACQKSSKGETQRVRLQKALFNDFEFHFPPLEKQNDFLKTFSGVDDSLAALSTENKNQVSYLAQLRQAILQEAIEGKLTADWRTSTTLSLRQSGKEAKGDPDYDAEALLEKIRLEKEKLIAEGKIKKQKPLPPIKPEEEPFELPEGWVWTRLDDYVVIRGGKRIPKGYSFCESTTKYIYIRIVDMKNGSIIKDNIKYIDTDVYKQISKYVIRKEDLYLTIAGTIGQLGMVPTIFDKMNLTENAVRITPIIISKEWLFHFGNSPFIQNQFKNFVYGMAQPKLAIFRTKKTIIPLPPLAEQQALVKRVEKVFAKVNDLEKQVNNRKDQTELLMQSVLREAFEVT